ncbi:nup133 [Lasius niger]|uniref:Nup133 n=1 Tax=Lasius niger TaxID=67767 RepID=A0A0J7MMB6_LASNI|nr:nup133 [Lasius niger]
MGGNNDHPNAMDIQSRLRWFVLGKYSTDLFSAIRANTVPKSYDSTLINAQDIHSQEQESIEIDEHEDEILTATCLSELPGDENIDPMESQDTELMSLSNNFKGPIEHDDNDESIIDTSNK